MAHLSSTYQHVTFKDSLTINLTIPRKLYMSVMELTLSGIKFKLTPVRRVDRSLE